MNDLEITKACAEAMGYEFKLLPVDGFHGDMGDFVFAWSRSEEHGWPYTPLANDAQAMALIKKFNIHLTKSLPTPHHPDSEFWFASVRGKDAVHSVLNYAICLCVAQLASKPRRAK